MNNEVETIYAGSNLAKPLGYAHDGPYKGWLLAKHPDGQWVTLAPIREIIEHREKEGSNDQSKR